METQKTINWKEEKTNLKADQDDYEKRNYWKPSPGKHKVEILSEGEAFDFEHEGKQIFKVGFEVKVNNSDEVYYWTVNKGLTESSLYGQLTLIGAEVGTLKGETITLLVRGTGLKTSYTVEESLPLMTPLTEEIAE